MTTQTASTNLVGKETTQTTWLQRLGLFILFLVCGFAILVFGSNYFEIFPTNKNLTYNLTISALFLVVALWLKRDKRLREVIQMHMEFLQANKNLFMKMSLEAKRLKPESQKKIQEKRHAYQDLLRALIEEGIREGTFRKVDSLVAVRILMTSLAPVVFT